MFECLPHAYPEAMNQQMKRRNRKFHREVQRLSLFRLPDGTFQYELN